MQRELTQGHRFRVRLPRELVLGYAFEHPSCRCRLTYQFVNQRTRHRDHCVTFSLGSVNATNSLEYPPPPMATMKYCFPLNMKVIGDPVCGAGICTAPTSFAVRLSYARSIAPLPTDGSV